MSKRKNALLHSILALLLCFSMLIGTTFAWFTDSVTSSNNRIMTGNLDVDMEYWNGTAWDTVGENTALFSPNALWEPGYTEVVYLKVLNKGNLALKYRLGVNIAGEVGSVNKAGEEFLLSGYIKFGVVDLGSTEARYATRTDARAALTNTKLISEGYSSDIGEIEANGAPHYIALVVYMPEETGNEANHDSDYDAPVITLGVSLEATQMSSESDSFGKTYDESASFAEKPLSVSVSMPIAKKVATETDATTGETVTKIAEEVTIGSESNGITAKIPADVVVADGATELKLTVKEMDESNANIAINAGETATSVDVHIEGIDTAKNTVATVITLDNYLPAGLNDGNVVLYHVENGATVPMTKVANPTEHNQFSYDPATGDVTIALKSFSEIVTVTDNRNPWSGEANTAWYNTTDSEFTLSNADQLAGLGVLVDNGTDTFAGKTVKLGADINLDSKLFNPIGCGYVSGVGNSNGVPGRAFMGTFDGQGHTIYGLYQNGWDLGLSYCNLGGGLFASVADATIKNLTISGANVVMECVEMGFVAGLAQGNCTFDNIDIYNSKIANYQRATGAIVGEVSAYNGGGTCTFCNINIGSDVVVGSLWGDFDCPVGGVIGARWDDANVTKVNMTNVNVACRLDVYNDVTSSYQWYAYRRAGMLIGNTDMADGHTATANFLTCENVVVYYGDWVNYHYCEFNNHNSSWPFVRVEKGENCSAYSNPRYGVPNDPVTGQPVTTLEHNHTNGDDHNIELKFNQLYGGGQGVYGQTAHAGVTTSNYAYTIQYINDNKVLVETFVENNTSEFKLSGDTNEAKAQTDVVAWLGTQGYAEDEIAFGGWENAGSTRVTAVPAGNTENIKLFPYFNSPYTARFVDQNGNVLAWCLFHSEKPDRETLIENTKLAAESKLTFDEGFSLDKWEVHVTDENGNTTSKTDYSASYVGSLSTDVTIYPVFKFNGDVNLIPVDEDGDGDTDYYQVGGYGANTGEQELVEIPAYVNGVPVTTINADAFSSYDDLHSVRIPGTITTINAQSFTADDPDKWGTQRDTITIYYEGDPAVWKTAMEQYNKDDYSGMLKSSWDNAMGDGSRVFFLDANGKVINTMYWELNDDWVWVLHEHAYTYEAAKTCELGEKSHYEYGGGFIGIGASLQEGKFTNYAGACDCSSCKGATRPDAKYWTAN